MFSGEWIDRIIGLEHVTVEVVMARAPDGSDMFEVVRFHSPSAGAQEPAPAANRPGLRHVAFKVDDVRGVVDRAREAGWDTVAELVDFENTFLLCYVRGPEGLIVELAELFDAFVTRYRRRLLDVVGEHEPYFYAFKRILFRGRLSPAEI